MSMAYSVTAEIYTMEWGPQAGNEFPFSSVVANDPRYGRLLQAGGTTCDPVGDRFACTTTTIIRQNPDDTTAAGEGDADNSTLVQRNSSMTELTIYTECDFDSQIKFDFRRSANCKCSAHVHRVLENGTSAPDKYCPCLICAAGFGDSPVSIDCSPWDNVNSSIIENEWATETVAEQSVEQRPDSLIVGECSSLDCGMGCNGTCRLDCATSDTSCPFCSNNPANQPTASPYTPNSTTDGGADPLTNFDGTATDSETKSSATKMTVYGTIIGIFGIIVTFY
jgi:hypothetical protein